MSWDQGTGSPATAETNDHTRLGKVALYLTLEIAAIAVVLLGYSWGMGVISTIMR